MRNESVVEELSRGLYRLADLPPLSNPDLVTVALKIPAGVMCLISALAYHEITTQIPHEVHLALPRGTEPPRLKHPPLRVFWFTGRSFTEGIETHKVDGIGLRVYSLEKTLADCFKYRNKLGLDTVLEALRLYRSRNRPNVDAPLSGSPSMKKEGRGPLLPKRLCGSDTNTKRGLADELITYHPLRFLRP